MKKGTIHIAITTKSMFQFKEHGFLFKHCSLLYQEVLRNLALLFLLSEHKYSLWY